MSQYDETGKRIVTTKLANAKVVTNPDGEQFVTAYSPTHGILVAQSDHPNFEAIVEGIETGDTGIYDLFDISKAIGARFEHLSERVTVAYGRVFFDGAEVDDSLTKQILRFQDEGVDDWKPLVHYFEKVQANPQDFSREQLYAFVKANDITIADNGDLILYKGVRADSEGLESTTSGQEPVMVDGVVHQGYIPNPVGATVEMKRDLVAFDPEQPCSVGLHVATWNYAEGYGHSGTIIKVAVNPRDVVSVPNDAGQQKVRVSRYRIIEAIQAPHVEAVVPSYVTNLGDFSEFDEDEGDRGEDCFEPFDDGEAQPDLFEALADTELDDTPQVPSRARPGISRFFRRQG